MAAESEALLRLGMQSEDVRFHAEVSALQHCRVPAQSVCCRSTACNEHWCHLPGSDATDTARRVMLSKDGEPASLKSLVYALAAIVDFLLTQVHSRHTFNSFAKEMHHLLSLRTVLG